MIKRVFNLPLLLQSIEGSSFEGQTELFTNWFNLPNNIMLAEGDNVGLATFELPGIYGVHWFFKVRGRNALNLGRDMLEHLFTNYDARIVRGVILEDNRASRWAARQVGYTSHGIMEFADGTRNEVFTLTKDDFFKQKEQKNG